MGQLARLLSVLEQLKRDPPPALLVSPRDAKDAVRAAILVKAMTPGLQARASGYAHEAGEMMRQRRLAAVESEALFTNDSERAEASPPPSRASAARPGCAAGLPPRRPSPRRKASLSRRPAPSCGGSARRCRAAAAPTASPSPPPAGPGSPAPARAMCNMSAP